MITQIDQWYSLSMEDIAKMEIDCMNELKEMIKSKEISQAYYLCNRDEVIDSQQVFKTSPLLCLFHFWITMEKQDALTEKEKEKGVITEKSGDKGVALAEEGVTTPIYKKEQVKRDQQSENVQIVDLSKSPKKRKREVGLNPYSRIHIHIVFNT